MTTSATWHEGESADAKPLRHAALEGLAAAEDVRAMLAARSALVADRLRDAIARAVAAERAASAARAERDASEIASLTALLAEQRKTATALAARCDTLERRIAELAETRRTPPAPVAPESAPAVSPPAPPPFRNRVAEPAPPSARPLDRLESLLGGGPAPGRGRGTPKATRESNLAERLESLGHQVVDRRPDGGRLWVIGGTELRDALERLAPAGHHFKFSPRGARATEQRPAWYLLAGAPPAPRRAQSETFSFAGRYRPSAALAVVIGPDPVPYAEAVQRVWDYVGRRRLQDGARNAHVQPDAALGAVFGGRSRVSAYDLPALVSKHLTPLDE